MRINAIEAIPTALPVRREWKWRGLGGDLGRWVIVRVGTEDGLIGLGEATPLPDWGGDFNRYAGETPATVMHLIRLEDAGINFIEPPTTGLRDMAAVIPISAPAGLWQTEAAGRYYRDDIVAEPFHYEAGLLYPPTRPGVGVDLDEKRLEKYRLDR